MMSCAVWFNFLIPCVTSYLLSCSYLQALEWEVKNGTYPLMLVQTMQQILPKHSETSVHYRGTSGDQWQYKVM